MGHTTTYSYDALNQLVESVDAVDSATTFTYDADGNVLAWTNGRGDVTHYAYDELNRRISVTDPVGGLTQYAYDAVGNLISITDPLGNRTSYGYDVLNRMISATDPLDVTTTYAYDAVGNWVSVTDGLGQTAIRTYDEVDRLVARTDANGHTVQFGYDAVGNVTIYTDPLGNVTRFGYDARGRLVTHVDPLEHARTFAYDAADNLIATTDRDGRTRTFAYDSLDRVTAESWWAESAVVRTMAFRYDPAGNLLGASDPDSSYAYTYDELNRVSSAVNQGIPNVPRVVLSYSYDAAGNLVSTRDSLGVQVSTSYDPRGLLTARTWTVPGADSVRIEFDYNARGDRIATRRFADETGATLVSRSTFNYDAARRLTQISHRDALDLVLAHYNYAYDVASRLVQESHHGQTWDYAYDDVGQLLAADIDGVLVEEYSYDANGNRMGVDYVLRADNRLESDGTYRYDYDAEGNLLKKTEIATGNYAQYAYDHRNRMVLVQDKSPGGIILGEVGFTYDVFDRRIGRRVDSDGAGSQPSETTFFVYDRDHVWADLDETGAVRARYLFGDQIDEIIARYRAAEGIVWHLTDHLGSVRDITDAAGRVIDRIDYTSFGTILSETNPSAGDRYRFTGREWDPEIGLYYLRARYYDGYQGRFVSQDPLLFGAGDSNLYRYVANGPLNAIDPTGLEAAISYSLLARTGRALAGGTVGAVLGYACGFLDGLTESRGDFGLAEQRARQWAEFGALAGATFGFIGNPKVGSFVGGLFAAVLVADAAWKGDPLLLGVRVGCMYFAGKVAPKLFEARAPSRARAPNNLPPASMNPNNPGPHNLPDSFPGHLTDYVPPSPGVGASARRPFGPFDMPPPREPGGGPHGPGELGGDYYPKDPRPGGRGPIPPFSDN